MISYLVKEGMADQEGSNSIREDAVAHARKQALDKITASARVRTDAKPKAVKRKKKNVSTSSTSKGVKAKRKKYTSKVRTEQRSSAEKSQKAVHLPESKVLFFARPLKSGAHMSGAQSVALNIKSATQAALIFQIMSAKRAALT